MSEPRFSKRLTLGHLVEGVRLALSTLAEHRMRSGLVMLGVAIAVATSMGMVAILSGFGRKIRDDMKGGDSAIVSVSRFSHIEEGDASEMFHRPKLTIGDAEALLDQPEVAAVETRYGEGRGRALHYGDKHARLIFVMGTNLSFTKFQIMDLERGRFFTEGEMQAARPVCVLAQRTSNDVFPGEEPIGKSVRINDGEYEVVGVFQRYDSLFGGLFENFAVIPYTTYEQRLKNQFESLRLNVFPADPNHVEATESAVRGVLRARHHLTPSQKDDFALTTSDAALEFVEKITKPVALVLVLISSIGLMVGGIGVLIIMLVSVTERTREIGVRKAIGASRREILWQFLIEAGVLTSIGGTIGVGLGLLLAKGASEGMHFPFVLPVLWVVIAVLVSASIGLVFGLFPANTAARLDPIQSLRYE